MKIYFEQIIKEKKYFVAYVGKFSPFHIGHKFTYDYLCNLPGITQDDVYVCTKLEDNSFLSATQKRKIIELSGVQSNRIINYSGYNIKGLLNNITNGNIKDNYVIITAFSEKDVEDKSKSIMFTLPKDEVMAWQKIKNIDDIKYLRPYNYVQKKYEDKKEIKEKKGNGYILITPTFKTDKIVSSSLIRSAIQESKWNEIRRMMATIEAFDYLKEVKNA